MTFENILQSFCRLKTYIERQDYKGWDPYDGLNSKVYRALPLVKRSAIFRLAWIQLFKRCPVNLRKLLGVPKQYNAKGIGLILQGYCNLYPLVKAGADGAVGSADEIQGRIRQLADLLLDMRSEGFSGSAWGYNFPWQCRREFLFPAGEPTVVATQFCASALLSAYEITGVERYKDVAVASAHFVMEDLRRTPHKGGFIFSYSRMPGNDTIYNASLLGSRLLALVYKYTGDKSYLDAARQSMVACCADQRKDGSWTYGVKPVTGWIDSFHTGYNLDAISAYIEITGDTLFSDNLRRGLDYYLKTFFNEDGSPKYYHNRQYPIDIHCPAQLMVTLVRLGEFESHKVLAEKVLDWTLRNMQAPEGYFYYQLKKGVSSRISYMRWSNAFMFYSMSHILRYYPGVL